MSIYYIFVYVDIFEYVYIDTVWYAVKTYGLRWIKIASRSGKVTHCEVMPSELMKIGHQNAIRNIMKYHYLQCAMARPTWRIPVVGISNHGAQQKKHGTTGPVTMAPWPHWTCHVPQHPKSIAAAVRRHSGPAPGASMDYPMGHWIIHLLINHWIIHGS